MHICPNCNATLSQGAASIACPQCNADFGPSSAWKPVDQQVQQGPKRLPLLRAVAILIGGALVIHGLWLLYRAFTHPYNPGPPGVFGIMSIFVGTAISASRTRGIFGLTLALGLLLLIGFLLGNRN